MRRLRVVLSLIIPEPNAAGEQRPTRDETSVDPKNLAGGPSAPLGG